MVPLRCRQVLLPHRNPMTAAIPGGLFFPFPVVLGFRSPPFQPPHVSSSVDDFGSLFTDGLLGTRGGNGLRDRDSPDTTGLLGRADLLWVPGFASALSAFQDRSGVVSGFPFSFTALRTSCRSAFLPPRWWHVWRGLSRALPPRRRHLFRLGRPAFSGKRRMSRVLCRRRSRCCRSRRGVGLYFPSCDHVPV